eukprot:5047253-Pyramimonas_sp.AAC.1
MQNTWGTLGEGGGVLARINAKACSLHADEANILVVYKLVEEADSVGPTAHACHTNVGLAAPLLHALPARLLADHLVELPHQHGIWVWAGCGAEDVVGALHVGHPVTDGL